MISLKPQTVSIYFKYATSIKYFSLDLFRGSVTKQNIINFLKATKSILTYIIYISNTSVNKQVEESVSYRECFNSIIVLLPCIYFNTQYILSEEFTRETKRKGREYLYSHLRSRNRFRMFPERINMLVVIIFVTVCLFESNLYNLLSLFKKLLN